MSPAIPRDVVMSAPSIGAAELRAVARVVRSGRLSMGPATERFEERCREVAGTRHAIACSSGTAGLHMGVVALGISAGEAVITPSFSFAASTNCFLYERAVPVFADIDPKTYNVDPESVREAALVARRKGLRVRAILPVHVFGQPCAMPAIGVIAKELGVPVIEDACEAIGATYEGRPAGSYGDLAVFAFYPNKQMTTGEGGVIVTNDDRIATVARSLRNQGRGEGGAWLSHVRLGYNYRIDEMSAALGATQLARLPALLSARDRVAALYQDGLRDVRGVQTPTIEKGTTRMSWFVYVVTLDRGVDRDSVVRVLAENGVETRPYFAPIHTQPYIRALFGDLAGSLPVTEDVGRRTLALPFHGGLTKRGVRYVVDALRHAIVSA